MDYTYGSKKEVRLMQLNIRRLRIQKRLSQEELARISGVSRPTISTLETNPNAITTTETLQKIAMALGVRVSDFFANND